jgi:hypothetical protein
MFNYIPHTKPGTQLTNPDWHEAKNYPYMHCTPTGSTLYRRNKNYKQNW